MPSGNTFQVPGSLTAKLEGCARILRATPFVAPVLLLLLCITTAQIGKATGPSTENGNRPFLQKTLILPNFRWPWDSTYNGQIFWTSGPHSWSKGGQITATISASRGNGLDFARSGSVKTFPVAAMANGTVIKNACGFSGLGCIVAIRHSTGGSVMVYAHLEQITTSRGTFPRNDLVEGQQIPQGTFIGNANQSGGQTAIHLHIELRDGVIPCNAPADSIDGNDCDPAGNPSIGFAGSPVGWDAKYFLDGYFVNGYFDSAHGCGPGADCDTIFNYDGSMVKGSIAAPFFNFPYSDGGTRRTVYAFVHPDFIDQNICDLSLVPPPDSCEIDAANTIFARDNGSAGGGGFPVSTNTLIQPPTQTPVPPGTTPIPPLSGDGISFCDGINNGTPCNVYLYTSNTACVDLAATGWDNRADSLRFLGNYIGNYDVILYDDNGCGVYNARYGSDASDLGAFKNSIGSIRIEKHESSTPTPADGVTLCDGTQFGQPCHSYTYTTNDTCINLSASGWADRADSLHFEGSYATGYEVVLYHDSGCSVYNARYGQDTADLGAFRNSIASMRIEQHGAPAGPNDGIALCDGTNNGTPCQIFYYQGNDTCQDLSTWSWDNRADSLYFRSGYIGGYDIILYDDNGCGVYNARYGSDASDLGAFKNAIGSIRIEKHGPASPDLIPQARPGRAAPVILSSVPGTSVSGPLFAGAPTYLDWGYQNTGSVNVGPHIVELYIDDQRLVRYPFSGLGAGALGGFDDWMEIWAAPGWHTVRLVVDADNSVDESDESNNVWEGSFYWGTISGWKGEYFTNPNLGGLPLLVRDDLAVDFDWGLNAPDPALPADDFSARWTKTVYFSTDTYRFSVSHDDGARVFLDDVLILDAWTGCCQTDTAQISIQNGFHTVRVELKDTGGAANISFWWELLSQAGLDRIYLPLLSMEFPLQTYAFDEAWGSGGSGAGQFQSPTGIAIGSDGAVFVLDKGNYRVQKFSSTGSYLGQWGSYGHGNGQFDGFGGIESDGRGSLYVADWYNCRIQAFTENGVFQRSWGSCGTGAGQFNGPNGIGVDPSGNVYVADWGNNRVQKFSADGSFLLQWGTAGVDTGQFAYPSDIAVGASGQVFISEYGNHRIQVFSQDGSYLGSWGSWGSDSGKFQMPTGIASDPNGKVFVLERMRCRIQRFTAVGRYLTQFGSCGSGVDQFEDVTFGLAVDSQGRVYVSDYSRNRILRFRVLP